MGIPGEEIDTYKMFDFVQIVFEMLHDSYLEEILIFTLYLFLKRVM